MTKFEPVAWRYRHSEGEKWHHGQTQQNWWESEPLFTDAQMRQARIEALERARQELEGVGLDVSARHLTYLIEQESK